MRISLQNTESKFLLCSLIFVQCYITHFTNFLIPRPASYKCNNNKIRPSSSVSLSCLNLPFSASHTIQLRTTPGNNEWTASLARLFIYSPRCQVSLTRSSCCLEQPGRKEGAAGAGTGQRKPHTAPACPARATATTSPRPGDAAGSAAGRGRGKVTARSRGRAANRKRRSQRRGRKRSGLVPDAAAAAICHLRSGTGSLSPLPRRLSPRRRLFPGPATSLLCSRRCFFRNMDLVRVASPEPGPAAVSGVRGWRTCLGPLGWSSRKARRGWQGPRWLRRRLGKFWAWPRRLRKRGIGGGVAGWGWEKPGRPGLPKATLGGLGSLSGSAPCFLHLLAYIWAGLAWKRWR